MRADALAAVLIYVPTNVEQGKYDENENEIWRQAHNNFQFVHYTVMQQQTRYNQYLQANVQFISIANTHTHPHIHTTPTKHHVDSF